VSRADRAAIADSSTVDPEPVDLLHLGRLRVICAWLLGEVIVDPGPASCLPALLDALGERVPRALALTHIHLDHAGAAGSLARRFPGMEVWVHERGARHLADPSRLLASASRLYGAEMDRLWGEVLPVPAERIRVLSGGETLAGMTVADTPGHASHHVSYLHEPSGWAFVGDMAGVRVAPHPFTLAPTPPPDIDVELWDRSIDLIAAWEPTGLGLTHFGAAENPLEQLEACRAALHDETALAAVHDLDGFVAAIEARIRAGAGADAASIIQAAPPDQLFQGLDRWRRKRAEAAV
jgi:glyoxylase-like metal-dependent hydrolase (beta-lactamase superfamily II)